jgi:hypothetical protein
MEASYQSPLAWSENISEFVFYDGEVFDDVLLGLPFFPPRVDRERQQDTDYNCGRLDGEAFQSGLLRIGHRDDILTHGGWPYLTVKNCQVRESAVLDTLLSVQVPTSLGEPYAHEQNFVTHSYSDPVAGNSDACGCEPGASFLCAL